MGRGGGWVVDDGGQARDEVLRIMGLQLAGAQVDGAVEDGEQEGMSVEEVG